MDAGSQGKEPQRTALLEEFECFGERHSPGLLLRVPFAGELKYCSAWEPSRRSVLLMYGAYRLPLICDQLWLSIRMIKTVWMFGLVAAWSAVLERRQCAHLPGWRPRLLRFGFSLLTSG